MSAIKIERFLPICILTNVKCLKTMTVLALLALWLGSTNHCRLEKIPGLEFLRCALDTDTDSNCDGDGCDVVEKALYKADGAQLVAVAPLFVAAVFLLPTPEQLAPHPLLPDFSTVASPELPGTWQFFYRTALPPRAPSLAS